MRITTLLLFFTVGFNLSINAQMESDTILMSSSAYSQIKELLDGKFHGYQILDTIMGELNLDGQSDLIVVLEKQDSGEDGGSSFLEIDRITVFLTQKNGVYLVKASNSSIVECSDCGGAGVGDPYRGITIENGTITFESLYGACDKTYVTCTFQYNEKKEDWYLIQTTRDDYNCNDQTKNGEIRVKSKKQTPKNFGKITFGQFQTHF